MNKIRAIYVGDIQYNKCPVFELNEKTNYFETVENKELKYPKDIVYSDENFLTFNVKIDAVSLQNTNINFSEKKIKEIFKKVLDELVLNKTEEKATLTIQECANLTGIGRDKITELIYSKNSNFPYFKVGSRFLINRKLVIEWLEETSKLHKQL